MDLPSSRGNNNSEGSSSSSNGSARNRHYFSSKGTGPSWHYKSSDSEQENPKEIIDRDNKGYSLREEKRKNYAEPSSENESDSASKHEATSARKAGSKHETEANPKREMAPVGASDSELTSLSEADSTSDSKAKIQSLRNKIRNIAMDKITPEDVLQHRGIAIEFCRRKRDPKLTEDFIHEDIEKYKKYEKNLLRIYKSLARELKNKSSKDRKIIIEKYQDIKDNKGDNATKKMILSAIIRIKEEELQKEFKGKKRAMEHDSGEEPSTKTQKLTDGSSFSRDAKNGRDQGIERFMEFAEIINKREFNDEEKQELEQMFRNSRVISNSNDFKNLVKGWNQPLTFKELTDILKELTENKGEFTDKVLSILGERKFNDKEKLAFRVIMSFTGRYVDKDIKKSCIMKLNNYSK